MTIVRVLERLMIDTASAVLYWPLWWYSNGFIVMLHWFSVNVAYYARLSAVGVWVRNIFTPMFGQYDWQSRMVSFIVRVGNIIVRGLGLCLWMMICACVILAYLLWPIALIYTFFVYGIGI